MIRQRKVLLQWIEVRGLILGESVIIALTDDVSIFSYEAGDWQERNHLSSEMRCRFVLCEAAFFLRVREQYKLEGNWQRIFHAKEFEVWESESYYRKHNLPLPLRLGLNDTEKMALIREVRRIMNEVLSGREAVLMLSGDLRKRLVDQQNLDVAVWVQGKLRASVIVTEESGERALEIASKRATWDKRFAPLALEEFPEARIEITFMSDLFFPVLESDYRRGDIDPTKGYRVTAPDGKRGWYLPEVHNCVSFRSLPHMLEQLTVNKAAIHREDFERCRFEQFSTFDWIENGSGIMTLSGPTETPDHERFTVEFLRQILESSMAWLGRLQKPDGSIPAIFSPHDTDEKMRLPALGGVGYALAFSGRVLENNQVLESAERVWRYLYTCLIQEAVKKSDIQYLFTTVYFLRLSLELKKDVALSEIASIVPSLPRIRNNPILWLQTLSFLADYEERDSRTYADLVRKEALLAYKNFQKRRVLPGEQVALYPELIAVYAKLFIMTGDVTWRKRGIEGSKRYQSMQQEDGSFPHSPERIFAYTRGTSKIFEALAVFPEENDPSLKKAFAWIRTMQYNQDNTFHLTLEQRRRLCGGFRHDAFNKEAWIDASAHVILGLARILKQ